MAMNNQKLLPFLKWPGGKRWLIAKHGDCFPKQFDRYYEPFLGGGAVFFFLQPSQAILSDLNGELIELYQVMRDEHSKLAQYMREHQRLHCKEYYYKIRSEHFEDPIQSASRFLYLNRMCYNGMYRVNKAGQFNVPIGTKQNCIYDIDQFKEYSTLLSDVKLAAKDFASTIDGIERNDFIFVDPPYTMLHNQNGFINYNENLFTWADQERLLIKLCEARNRGAYVLGTNAHCDALKKMYLAKGFHVKVLERFNVISGKADKRRKQDELLISSYPICNSDQGGHR